MATLELFRDPKTLPSPAASIYYCGMERCSAGHAYGPAIRTQYLFHYVASGKGVFRTKNAVYRLTAGQGFLIVPSQLTYYQADPDTPWTYYWIGFDGTEVPGILADCGLSEENPIYRGEAGGQLQVVLGKIIETFRTNPDDKYAVLSLFYSAVALMQNNGAARHGNEDGYVEKALDYLHHNYTYRIRVEDIARYVGLDRTYLFKLFVRHTGKSPQEYLIRYRLERAAVLLRETKLSTTEIAYSCGFRDSPSFCRHFKKHYGVSPLAYRRQAECGMRNEEFGMRNR